MSSQSEIEIREFDNGDTAAFVALNRRWIEEHFEEADADRALFADPHGMIVRKGGSIFMACENGRAVGTGALVPAHNAPADGRDWWEIIKMATDPTAQGKGVGQRVIHSLIERARQNGADALWLETNDALSAAVRLYERVGFRRLSPEECWPTPYDRCNLQLVLEL